MSARTAVFDRATILFVAFLLVLTGLRIAGLRATPLDLHFDEAQYWAWSRSFEFGYFSKPPLIAWAIAATTALFGEAEWAVRLASPVAQGLTAAALYLLGRSLYGAWAGFWAGVGWLTLPGVFLSSAIVSTDAVLLPCWAFALFATWRLIATRAWIWAILLGVTLGVGVLAKYAMLYFVLCAAAACWWWRPARDALVTRQGAAAGLIALVVVSPNLYWNVVHGFATVAHTASNTSVSADLINPEEWLEFTLSQTAVIGPLFFLVFIGLLWRALWNRDAIGAEDKFLAAFTAPPLLIVMAIAFISRANANWAVVAYPAAIVWVAGSCAINRSGRRFLAATVALHVAFGAVLAAAWIRPEIANQIGAANAFKRSRGWEETAREIALRAVARPGEPPFTAVLVDHRALYYQLAYYWRAARAAGAPLPPVRMWVLHADARNSAELSDPMRPEEGARVLVVHQTHSMVPVVAGDFTAFRTVEQLAIPLGGGINRELEISVGEGFAPAPRDEAFEARLRGE